MIAEIRDYIRGIVTEIDPDLKENPSAFYDGDIGESLLDRSYQVSINNLDKTLRTDFTERTMTVVVTIFGLGFRSEIENYDELLEKAICIEDSILHLQAFHKIATITNIESAGIQAEKIPSNDDAFQININLTLTQAYTRE